MKQIWLKFFPDGKAHFDPVTHKIQKPDYWQERHAPEVAIKRVRQTITKITTTIR